MNRELEQFMRNARRELKYTVPHRRGIILGYHQINLDTLVKEGAICEGERLVASYQLDKYAGHTNNI